MLWGLFSVALPGAWARPRRRHRNRKRRPNDTEKLRAFGVARATLSTGPYNAMSAPCGFVNASS
jgi:hypothetical protein